MATHEKVDVVIAGAGASGSVFAAVLSKAGKKVVLIDNGPDWQMSDLISSDMWGRRIKPAGPPFILEGKQLAPVVYHGGWGVGGAALHWFANVPRREVTPGERFAHMIETLFGLARLGHVNAKGMPSPLQLALVGQEFSDVIVFRKPPVALQRALFAVLAPIARRRGYRATYPQLSRTVLAPRT